jgi:hypothetical protein
MSDLTDACTTCGPQVTGQFGPAGTRGTLNVVGPTPVPNCCIFDVIEFSGGQLIFTPLGQGDKQDCVLMCRSLIVSGGKAPVTTNPCNPGSPGTQYAGSNVITWNQRLITAPAGLPVVPAAAAPGGNPGNAGSQGNPGAGGRSVGAKLLIITPNVQIATNTSLLVDWAGQGGGAGGTGQNGGNGATGATGSMGQSGGWPGTSCQQQPGNGGNGANGGSGGTGGAGGDGGAGGQVAVIGTAQSLQAFQTQILFVLQSNGGAGGNPGNGGQGGLGGNPGLVTEACNAASPGSPGSQGSLGSVGAAGNAGAQGAAPNPAFEPLVRGTCADIIPRPLAFPAGYPQQLIHRCLSGSGTATLAPIVGQFFNQVASVSCSLANVTVTILPTSTDTQLNLSVSAAANSATGPGDLTFNYTFPGTVPAQTMPGAINVAVWGLATAIAPTNGAHGTAALAVTITGTGFDPSAAFHNVTVSGGNVTVVNVAVVSDTQITCTFEIAAAATVGARDVTVAVGASVATACSYTFVGSFTIT